MIEGLTTRLILSPAEDQPFPAGWDNVGLPTIVVEGPAAPHLGLEFFMEGLLITKVLPKGTNDFIAYATVTDPDAWDCLLAQFLPGRERGAFLQKNDCYDREKWYVGTKL